MPRIIPNRKKKPLEISRARAKFKGEEHNVLFLRLIFAEAAGGSNAHVPSGYLAPAAKFHFTLPPPYSSSKEARVVFLNTRL